jgi:hypothetical protein
MTDGPHSRAHKLLAQSLIEGLSPADQSWLDQHIRHCQTCALEAASTHSLLQALRAAPVTVPRDLLARTQLAVRLRAEDAARSSHSGLLLWLVTAMSWLLGVFSAPLIWHAFTWLGAHFGLPKPFLEMGFILWWAVPALLAVAAVLHQKSLGSPTMDGRNNQI